LAYFLIVAVRTEVLLRDSVQGSMTDTELARTAAEFIINGEILRLNKRVPKNLKKVEALLDLGDFDLVQTLLWSDRPGRRTAEAP